jgi:hypothetical protein
MLINGNEKILLKINEVNIILQGALIELNGARHSCKIDDFSTQDNECQGM